MALLDQLFGQQPQDNGGLVQNILSQRFAPSQQDAAQATYQTLTSPQPVSSYTTQAQRLQAPMAVASQLGNLQQQGEQTRALQMQNQMTQFNMPFIQGQMQDLYNQPQNGNAPAQGQSPGLPPVGFNAPNNQSAPDPRLKRAELAAMMGNKPLSETIMAEYNADPNVIRKKKEAETQGTDIENAQKGVVGIDSRLQNAIDILNEQIDLAPKTYSGWMGEQQEKMERNYANINPKGEFPNLVAQTKFTQNNANLFTQELPAIMQGMPGSRMDIPLINAIKNASQVNEYGAPAEKTAALQNLKTLLMKYQQNTHNYAKQMGGGETPIEPVNDANPPYQEIPAQGGIGGKNQQQSSEGQLQTKTINGQTFINKNGTWYHQ